MLKKGGIDFRYEAFFRGAYFSTFTGTVAAFSLQASSSCTGLVTMLLRCFLSFLDFTLVVVGGSARSLCLLGLAFFGEGGTFLKRKSHWVWTTGMQ
eukprot:scaffold421297_cov95-Attheya_sp.AAC.2